MTQPQTPEHDPVARIANWVTAHRTALIAAASVVVVSGGGIWFWITAQQRREAFAGQSLVEARQAAMAGNLALAASDLSRITATYSGTSAGGEAAILLGQIRLMQKDPEVAVTELREFLAGKPGAQFLAPAHNLLAVALEESGQPGQAAEQYLAAAAQSWYELLEAQYLLDAGRTFAIAGDTSRAIATYQRVLSEFEDTGTELEARVRIAELQRSSPRTDS